MVGAVLSVIALGLSTAGGQIHAAAHVGVATGASKCARAKGTTLALSKAARVYSSAPQANGDARTYACLFGRGKRVALDDGNALVVSSFGRGQVRLKGDKVAVTLGVLSTVDFAVDCDYEKVEVYGLSIRRRIVSVEDGDSCIYEPEIHRLYLRPSGSVAWSSVYGISRVPVVDGEPTSHDFFDANIDDGRQVKPESLRLRGTRLTWLHGATRRTTTLR